MLYIILHGHCKTVIQNKSFLAERRNLREKILGLYSLVEKSIEIEAVLVKKQETDEDFVLIMEELVDVQQKLLKMRKVLKRQADKLEKMQRYVVVREYDKGEAFGEIALLYDQPRAASINASKTSFFATIHKDDYVAYVKRFEKK